MTSENNSITPELDHALFKLELKHDRNRRPACVTPREQNRWAVTLDDPNGHTVCVSPEFRDGVAGQEDCAYESAICKALSILLNSDFAHNEGFVEVISSLCKARDRSTK